MYQPLQSEGDDEIGVMKKLRIRVTSIYKAFLWQKIGVKYSYEIEKGGDYE